MERYHATSVLSLTARHPGRPGRHAGAAASPYRRPDHAPACFSRVVCFVPESLSVGQLLGRQNYSGSSPLALITAAASCVVKNLTTQEAAAVIKAKGLE